MSNIMETFIDNVFFLMEKKQVQMSEINEYLGMSKGWLWSVKTNRGKITLDKAYEIAEYLETTLNVLTDKHFKTNMIISEKKRKIDAMKKEIAKLEEEIREASKG